MQRLMYTASWQYAFHAMTANVRGVSTEVHRVLGYILPLNSDLSTTTVSQSRWSIALVSHRTLLARCDTGVLQDLALGRGTR